MAKSHIEKKEKRDGQRPRKRKKKHKVLMYAKGIRVKRKKNERSTK